MNSGGIALRHVQDVGQFAISIPPQRNTPIVQPQKEKGSCAQRQVPVIVTGDEQCFFPTKRFRQHLVWVLSSCPADTSRLRLSDFKRFIAEGSGRPAHSPVNVAPALTLFPADHYFFAVEARWMMERDGVFHRVFPASMRDDR